MASTAITMLLDVMEMITHSTITPQNRKLREGKMPILVEKPLNLG
jgi:hypothetical protein